MKEHFVNYTQALALKELGFDEPCFGRFMKESNDLLIANSRKQINLITRIARVLHQQSLLRRVRSTN